MQGNFVIESQEAGGNLYQSLSHEDLNVQFYLQVKGIKARLSALENKENS